MMEKNGKVEVGKTPGELSGKPSSKVTNGGVPVHDKEEEEQVKEASEKKITDSIDIK